MVVLLSWTASARKWQGTVQLTVDNSTNISADAIYDDVANTVTLGNGYNACISHFKEGILTIPGSYDSYKVVIGPMAFRFCSYLTEVRVEEGVTTIGAYAFVGCSKLHTVRLPSTLTTIGSGAFSELPSLKLVYCNAATAPTWQWNDIFSALGTKASLATMAAQRFLYVPEGSFDSYIAYKFDGTATNAKEKVGWADAFTRIYEMNDNPQTISSLADLIEFRDAVNSGGDYNGSTSKSVTLTADIDMKTVSNWTPIGKFDMPFDGAFDGGGHVIKNLKVDLSGTSDSYAGLFGHVSEATIYNLHLMNPVVKGDFGAGAVAGVAENNTRIADVLVTSDATNDIFTVSANTLCGGIAGSCEKSVFERCLFRGRIKANSICGGIVGTGELVTAIDCSADNEIKDGGSGNFLGGIVGYCLQATLTRCMARNYFDRTATNATIGWLVGKIEHLTETTTSNITNCAYWKHDDAISMASTGGSATLNEADNQSYASSVGMMGDATKNVLGDGWHYFTGLYQDYPIPATLLDMYLNHIVYVTTSDGLVFAPIGNPSDFMEYQVVDYTGTAKSVTIPAQFNSKPVTAIGNRAFYDSDITSINLGSVETIDESAFEECDALQTVSLPNSVTTVNKRAFWHCDNLTSFTIGKNFQNHDGNFLAYCHKLQSLTIGSEGNSNGFLCQDNVLIHKTNNTTYIVACAPGKTGHYTIPTFSGYNYIHLIDNCFEGCTGLTSITFPDCTCYLPNGVFNGLTNLHYIDMNLATACDASHTKPVSYTVGHRYLNNPFYGTNKATVIYLKSGQHEWVSDFEYNVVIGGSANRLLLTDGWDFFPPTDVTSRKGVYFDRKLQATRTEITQKTGNKITLKDENDLDVEVDELEVTGYTYTPRGYSVCLPYALTLTAENAKVFVPSAITDGDDWRVTFTEVTNKQMEAYTPYYIVVSGEEEVSLSTSGRTTIGSHFTTVNTQTVGTGFEFKGTTTAISNASLYDADKPAYILQSDGNWHKVPANTENAYVPPFRAYFQASNAQMANQLTTMLNAIELSDVADNSTLLARYAGQTVSVTLRDRTIYKDGDWNTLCLPFDVTDGNTEDEVSFTGTPLEGATVMTFNGETSSFNASTGLLTLNFDNVAQNSTIAAGTPFIVKWTGTDVTNPVFSDVTISSTAAGSVLSKDKNVRFLGTYSPVVIYSDAHDNLYLGAANTLYWPSTEGYTMGSCRAYFHVDVNGGAAAVRQFVLNFGDDGSADGSSASGIAVVSPATDADGDVRAPRWYDLQGRRVKSSMFNCQRSMVNGQLKKGIYIHNGKKVLVRDKR